MHKLDPFDPIFSPSKTGHGRTGHTIAAGPDPIAKLLAGLYN